MTAGIRLRVVADDVGQSAAIDDGVATLARAGHLSAASVLLRAPGAPTAMAGLDGLVPLGVHVQLEPAEIRAADSARIAALITEQVEAMISAGHSPAHLDLHTAALYGLGENAERPGGVVAEAIVVAAAYRLRFRLPRCVPAGLAAEHGALHTRAVAAAVAAGVTLPDVLVTEVPAAADVPAFLAGLPALLAGGPGLPVEEAAWLAVAPAGGTGSPGGGPGGSAAELAGRPGSPGGGPGGSAADSPATGPGASAGLADSPATGQASPAGAAGSTAGGEVELITHPASRADAGDPLGPERVRQYALLASGALHPR